MSEVQARSQAPASRGRGGGRGGRGGFGGRGEARSGTTRRPNGDKAASSDAAAAFDDDSDLGQLKKLHGEKLATIKELFPDWSDADVLYALQETDGDVEVTATRISEGTISQWGEVSKPKKTLKPKAKESAPGSTGLTETSGNGRTARGGRIEGGRGGRGARGSERARGGAGRGRASAAVAGTNGQRVKENQQLSVPTDESPGWGNGTPTAAEDATATANEWGSNAWGTSTTDTTTATPAPPAKEIASKAAPTAKPAAAPAPAPEVSAAKPKTWASMLRQSTVPPKQAPKPKEAPVSKTADAVEPTPAAESTPHPEATAEEPSELPAELPASPPAEDTPKIVEAEIALPPSEDTLTKGNLEQLPDISHPPTTATAASTAADSWDPRQGPQSATATPLSASQAQHQATRPAASGYATSAIKATESRATRVPSYQRRLLEQEEAVRMPGNREVDRAAVQFGAFSLNGTEDDIDGDREEAETRAQPPSDSPVQPRAALPPLMQATAVPDSFSAAPAQKPAASLPQPTGASAPPLAPPTGPSAATGAQTSQPLPGHQQYGRFGQTNTQDQTSFSQKPYDSFGQQTTAASAGSFDSFGAPSSQPPSQPATAAAAGAGAAPLSSAAGDYSSYYTADQQSRNPSYNNYYGQQYGQQQGGQGQNDGPNAQQRAFAGYNASQNTDNLSQYPQSGAQQQSRYGAAATSEAQNSGNNTPNPASQAQQQPQPGAQNNGPQSNLHQQPPNSYPYSHPYYSSPFYAQYMQNSYGGGYGQGGYGAAPYGKGGLYGQPHQYGISHQSPYDHSSSPATTGFSQTSAGGRDSGLGSSIDNYGRAGSAQSGAPGFANSGFGGSQDTFGRAGSSYQSQAGHSFNGPNAQSGSVADDLKPYGDNKAAGGPSPSLAAAARPGSATNNTPGQSGLPPPQSGGQGSSGYGAYPSHLQSHGLHANQSGNSGYGLGGAGNQQGHGSGPYGGAYGGYGGNQQGGFSQYGARQQGWGNNY